MRGRSGLSPFAGGSIARRQIDKNINTSKINRLYVFDFTVVFISHWFIQYFADEQVVFTGHFA